MNSIYRIWKRLRKYERAALIITLILVVLMMLLGLLALLTLINLNMMTIAALMALLMGAQTVQQWRKNRKPAIYCLITAAVLVLFACFVHFVM